MFLFAPIRWALRLPSVVLSAALVYLVVTGVQVVVASRQQSVTTAVTPAAAIVVLPAPVVGSGPSPDLVDRLEQAALLYRAGVAPKVIVAGTPSVVGAPSPAVVAQRWLTAAGVPSPALLALPSPNASSTLAASAALLGSGAKVVVVTDAMDALWTRGAASSDALQAQVSPAVGSARLSFAELGPLWRQASGVAAGRIIGYSRTTWAGG